MAAEGAGQNDLTAIAAALIASDGHTGKAAKALGMAPAELRRLVKTEPELVDAALEAAELAMDAAEAAFLKALRTGQLSTRLQAAAFIARRRL